MKLRGCVVVARSYGGGEEYSNRLGGQHWGEFGVYADACDAALEADRVVLGCKAPRYAMVLKVWDDRLPTPYYLTGEVWVDDWHLLVIPHEVMCGLMSLAENAVQGDGEGPVETVRGTNLQTGEVNDV